VRRIGGGVVAVLVVAALMVGCSSGAHPQADSASSETTVSEVPSTTTTEAPTTTVIDTTTVPTTVSPTTAPTKPTTTTVDPALAHFYALLGGPRETQKPLPDPHGMGARTRCTTVTGGYGVEASIDWSDGFTEWMNSPGPFTVSTKRVGVGARGSTADIVITGPNCSVVVHDISRA
jgi:hypothetical protein